MEAFDWDPCETVVVVVDDDLFVGLDDVDLGTGIFDDEGDLLTVDDGDDVDDEVCGSFGEILTWVLRSRNQPRTLKRFGSRDEGRWFDVLVVVVVVVVVVRIDGITVDECVYFNRNDSGDSFSNWLVIRSNKSLSP